MLLIGAFLTLRFNPTLVRLRPPPPGPRPAAAVPFQSHAGSIEAGVRPQEPSVGKLFQSHAGSIEATQKTGSRISHCIVSIPRWFD